MDGKVAVLNKLKNIEVKTLPVPEITDDEMLVKVEGCGICGTDVFEYKADPFKYIPVNLGHEGTGEIVKMGKNVKTDWTGKPLKVGDKIICGPAPSGDIYGLMGGEKHFFNGWLANYMVINPNSVVFNVSDMPLDLRILIEPAAVSSHAVAKAKEIYTFKHGSTVLVQGVGPIGLMVTAQMKTLGIRHIIAVDGNPDRLALAKKIGATATVNIQDGDPVEAVKKLTNGKGVNFAFQCTGSTKGASTIWNFLGDHGGICEVGFFVDNGKAKYNPHFNICMPETKVTGSWAYVPEDWVEATEFLRETQAEGIDMTQLVTNAYPLDQLNEAMVKCMSGTGVKVCYKNNE
ncbi:zinc-dependent alcohol dehydrogenase [Lactobacillus kefiranofaciens]|uniref:zinc-dependent alcohol dehydrogenase n=1 Tax=Lactobacillus kefiranofaciens TaxID=267818 RepID=UPI00166E7E44|nr:zinc-binding dehydrogenase [Lactobacillus kefiranofaciens]MCJ2172180.1 zinc-binding dehydrogenase [Lactobacillus kefiranofaciens]QNT43807.1 zinc-binding dehydrogenase [Lactobacillus kefiranofaciens]